jgi:hypothetical protein
MVEQLFTVRREKSGNGKERTKQLFIGRRETETEPKTRIGEPEKRGNGEEGCREELRIGD